MGKGAPSLGLFLGRMVVFYVFALSVTVATVTGNAYPLSTTKRFCRRCFGGNARPNGKTTYFLLLLPYRYHTSLTVP